MKTYKGEQTCWFIFNHVFDMVIAANVSTWMVVGSERCEQMQMANNMCSVIMVVLQLIVM